ncbi:DL-glycerol-3-phosphatase [Fusarium falciforme]
MPGHPGCGTSVKVMFDGLLIDMDGTIVDSTSAVIKNWKVIAEEIGVKADVILRSSHGRRTMDVFEEIAPDKADWEHIKSIEGRLPRLFSHEVVEIQGARSVLSSLVENGASWAIVTSGTVPLVTGWLSVLNLPQPVHLITAESVERGKPDPPCYLLGREHLCLREPFHRVLVVEDSPARIRAGKLAGCKVLGLVTSHTLEQIAQAEPDWIVKDLESIKLKEQTGGKVMIEISNVLYV